MGDERKQYWEDLSESWHQPNSKHALIELRATMAWELVRYFGGVAGVYMDREDSAKRAVMDLQTPGALVTRCFAIADAFVNRAENREEIRQLPEKEKPQPGLGALIKDTNALIGQLNMSRVPVPQNTVPQEDKEK